MGMTSAMATLIASMVNGEATTDFTNATSYIGVGDSVTAFANSQTDLQAATNRLKKAMQATYPQRAGAAITYQSLYATTDANFAWQEWGVFNGGPAFATGTMFNRKVESLGTKANTQAWQFTVTLTVTAA